MRLLDALMNPLVLSWCLNLCNDARQKLMKNIFRKMFTKDKSHIFYKPIT